MMRRPELHARCGGNDLGGRLLLAILLLLGNGLALSAQSPHDDWQTLESEHFRMHFPSEYSEWAEHAASRLASISETVAAEVGYAPASKIEVLVMNPRAQANGSAWAILNAPRMILWTTPPDPLSTLGHFYEPVEELLIHEQVHLAHLLRPSRNPLRHGLESLLPVGPIAHEAPRWVSEGYATLLEGQISGAGRPHSEIRSAILRRWAQAGQLPSYGALASDSKRWLGMSMAYLVGSAYLEWLQERSGDESLRNLWARMTAREKRSFDEAFIGVFGDAPDRLYARFRAELTARAIGMEESTDHQEGELWQRLAWTTGGPDVSPDGRSVVVVRRSRDQPARLVVLSTAPDEEAERKRQERIERMLERDPGDVAPVQSQPLARKPEFELLARDRAGFGSPRWTADGESILYSSFEPDARGDLHPDLFLWHPETGERRRITEVADLRQADPAPSGHWAIAVRHRFGLSQLVRVGLEDGVVEEVTPASLERVYAHPRVSPDGEEIAFVVHEEHRWRLMRYRLRTGRQEEVRLPPDTTLVARPDWIDDDSLRVILGRRGSIEIYELEIHHPGYARRLTQSRGAALAYSSARGSDELFFLSLETHGLDLRRLDLAGARALRDVGDSALGRPLEEGRQQVFAETDLPPASRYGLGKQELMVLAGGAYGPSARSFEAGMRSGDLVGRLDTLLIGAFGADGGTSGLALASSWRGWPVGVSAHLFDLEEVVSRQPTTVPELDDRLDVQRRGLEVAAAWRRHWRDVTLELDGRGLLERVEPATAGPSLDRSLLHGSAHFDHHRKLTGWQYGLSLDAGLARGRTGDDSWSSLHSTVGLRGGSTKYRLGLSWSRSNVEGAEKDFDRIVVGGMASSISPASLEIHRKPSAALPRGVLLGETYEGIRLVLDTDLLPVHAFYEGHRVWDEGSTRSPWLEVAGLGYRAASEPIPLLRLPAFELELGAALLIKTPYPELDDEIEWWFSMTYRP